jgi:hypothetical protein
VTTPGNLGFEIAGVQPGAAASWSVATVATAAAYASFNGGNTLEPPAEAESFDSGWVTVFDATEGPDGSGLLTLPTWISITCATSGRTAQTSEATLRVGFGADAARARRPLAGAPWGLSVESPRAQALTGGETWGPTGTTGGSMVITHLADVDPAGTSKAALFDQGGNQVSDYFQSVVGQTFSVWVKAVAGTPPLAHFRHNAGAGQTFVDVDGTTTWHRINATNAASTTDHVNFETRDVPIGAGVIAGASQWLAYGAQLEDGRYPSSAYFTAGTRAADVVRFDPYAVANDGYFTFRARVRPVFASTEITADADVVFFDSNNRVFVRASDQRLVLRIGGVDITSPVLSWTRDQIISLRASHTAAGRTLSVDVNGAPIAVSTAGALPAIVLSANGYAAGNATGAQECLDLIHLSFDAKLLLTQSVTEAATYASALLLPPPPRETFEVGWSGNESYLFTFSGGEAAGYNSGAQSFEAFEQDWANNAFELVFVGGDLEDGLFSEGPAETFDVDWDNNAFALSWTTPSGLVSAASYDGALAPQAFEDFEQALADIDFTVNPSSDVFTAPVHGMPNGTTIYIANGTGGDIPAGTNKHLVYFVISTATNTYQLSLTSGGSAIDVGDAGTGQSNTTGDPARYWVSADFLTTI